MADWRLLSRDAGKRTRVLFDSDGRVIFHTEERVDPVLEANHALRTSGRRQDKDLRHVAKIPNSIVVKWMVEEGVNILDGDHTDFLARKLNDPDWAYLRTGGGRLGVSNGVMR